MWKYFGVFCNVCTVLLGGSLGLFLRSRAKKSRPLSQGAASTGGKLPPRENLPEVMMVCLGFCTIFSAASGLLGVESGVQALISVGSMVVGFLLGWWLRIDDRLNQLGDKILEKFSKSGSSGGKNPAEGVVTATLLFCIGSMTFLGSFESAANPAGALELSCHTTLLIKSMLDFVSATCLAVTFGASVLGSAVVVLVFQGMLVLLASTIQPFLERIAAMPVINCVGSMILLAIALNLLGIKKIKTADYLPALFIPILICWLLA
jgi:hypothetical protein